MQQKFIGQKQVNPLGIGTWSIGGRYQADHSNDAEQIAALQYSLKQGQNHIDTAEFYSSGHAEEVVGQAIKPFNREDLFIASKIWKNHASREQVPPATKAILERLELKKLDLLYAHAAWEDVDLESYILGLSDAVDQGLTSNIGVSNFNLAELKLAQKISNHPIAALQNHYNLLHKQEVPKELEDYCVEHDIAIVAYSPLARGSLINTQNETIQRLTEKYPATPAQIALNWLVAQPNTHAIPKSTSKAHITENLEALDFEMSQKDIAVLSELDDN